jgi:hypothetical protein
MHEIKLIKIWTTHQQICLQKYFHLSLSYLHYVIIIFYEWQYIYWHNFQAAHLMYAKNQSLTALADLSSTSYGNLAEKKLKANLYFASNDNCY